MNTHRAKKPCCGRCRHAGFWRRTAPDGRPQFVCGNCGDSWTAGHAGGTWMGHEMGEAPAQDRETMGGTR